MPAGEATVAQLDALSVKLTASGKGADFFQQAIIKTSKALDVSKAASLAANTALSEGTTEYKRLERAALQASKAAERAAVKNQGVVPEDFATKALAASTALDKHARTLKAVEKEATRAEKAEKKLGRTLGNVRKLSGNVDASFARQADKLTKLQSSIGSIGGPLGALGGKFASVLKGSSELTEVMGKSRAAMILAATAAVALAAVVVALTAVMVIGTIAIAAWGVSLASSARSAGLSQEAAEALNPELRALSGVFRDLKKDTGLETGALNDLTKKLQDAKVSAGELPAALRAAALAEAALGTGGSAEFIKQIKEGKLTVNEFAVNAQQKFGGIVERQMLGLGAQAERLKRNFGELFGGLNIDPVLAGMQILVGFFDEATVIGQTMKFLFESIFQPLIDQAETAALVVEAFVLGFLIGMTKVFIAVKPAIKAVQEFFGFEDDSLENLLGTATDLGELLAVAFVGVVAIFGVLVGFIGLVVVGFLGLLAAAGLLIVGIVQLGVMIVDVLVAAFESVLDFFAQADLVQLGTDLIMGLVNGIAGGGGAVIGAITKVVGGAISAAKRLLGISSPSKVFASFGENTGEGFTDGVEDTTGGAQNALSALVEPPEAPASALASVGAAAAGETVGGAAAAAAGGGGGGGGIDLSGATFVFQGVEGAEDAEQRFSEMLTRLIEGDVTQLGGEPAPEETT
jgi:hypothetical protein